MNISVIIPTFNRAHTIERAIDSVLGQTVPANEIINDGSTDTTNKILKGYGTLIKSVSIENRGVSHARNVGIECAQNEWIAFLDSDDEWKPNKLKIQMDEIEANPEIVFCHSNEIWIRNGKRINQMKKHKKYGGWVFNKNVERCIISPSTVLMNKSIMNKVGNFNTEFPICEDYDLWLRVTLKYPISFIEDALVIKYGGHKDQLSLNTNKIEKFRIQALVNLLTNQSLELNDEYTALVTLIHKCKIYLSGAAKRNNKSETNHMEKMIEPFQLRYLEIQETLKDTE